MAKVALSPLDELHEQIRDALAELRGARDDHNHCPSVDNQRTVEYAEARLDKLFERRKNAPAKREPVRSR